MRTSKVSVVGGLQYASDAAILDAHQDVKLIPGNIEDLCFDGALGHGVIVLVCHEHGELLDDSRLAGASGIDWVYRHEPHVFWDGEGELVYGAANYRFADFLKIGLPMNVVVGVATCLAIDRFYG